MSNYIYGVFYEDGTIVVLSPHDEDNARKLAEDFNQNDSVTVMRAKVEKWETLG